MKEKMQLKKYTFLLGIFLMFTACKEAKTEKTNKIESFSSQSFADREVGWSILIPEGWEMIPSTEMNKNNKQGQQMLEKEDDSLRFGDKGLKQLANFRKDKQNVFLSNADPYKESYKGQWKRVNIGLKKSMHKAYENLGFQVDSTTTTTVKIDGLDFLHYGFTLYNPKKDMSNTVLIYLKLINGFSFSASILYDNEEDKKILLKALFDSQFRK